MRTESALPGLSEWRRVMDWRVTQIQKLLHVFTYLGSRMSAADVLEAGPRDVLIATGAKYRRDGIGRREFAGRSDRPNAG